MRNRLSSHLFVLLALIAIEVSGYYAIHRAALIRGYETSLIGAGRDLLIYLPLIVVAFWLTRAKKFKGNWTLYTTAILLFSIGLLVQYRLYSDPEYNAKNKAEARAKKTETLRLRYIEETYTADKKQMMGLPPTPPHPVDPESVQTIESTYSVGRALVSSYTWIPIFSFLIFGVSYWFCVQDRFLSLIQRHSFIIVLLTLVPLSFAIITSSAGKALGNMTPWEPSKIPFLLGFEGMLSAR